MALKEISHGDPYIVGKNLGGSGAKIYDAKLMP